MAENKAIDLIDLVKGAEITTQYCSDCMTNSTQLLLSIIESDHPDFDYVINYSCFGCQEDKTRYVKMNNQQLTAEMVLGLPEKMVN